MNPFEKIRQACQIAKKAEIRIVRGPTFDWAESTDKPKACCALGAVLWQNEKARDYKFITDLTEILEVNEFWIVRFLAGFDRNNQIMFNIGTHEKPIWKKDEISQQAMKFAKEIL